MKINWNPHEEKAYYITPVKVSPCRMCGKPKWDSLMNNAHIPPPPGFFDLRGTLRWMYCTSCMLAQYKDPNWGMETKRKRSFNPRHDDIKARIAMYGGKCWICGDPYSALDHVKPYAKGGYTIPCNCRPICRKCNRKKFATWPFPLDSKSAYDTLYTT